MLLYPAKLLQIMSKLQILLDKGNVTFNNNNKWKERQLLNAPRAAIFDPCVVLLFQTKEPQLSNNKGNAVTSVMKILKPKFVPFIIIKCTFPLCSKICNLHINIFSLACD